MKIDVIIPVYNVGLYISKTIGSLLKQRDQNFKIIIVDDGSTDNTVEIVEKTFKSSGFSNYMIINQSNQGVSSARNAGIKASRADYIYFLDGDDVVSKDLIVEVRNNIKSETDLLLFAFDEIDEAGVTLKSFFDLYTMETPELDGISLLQHILAQRKTFWISMISGVYRRELLVANNIYFTDNCVAGEDQEFIFKVAYHAKRVVFLNQTLSFYVRREGSATKSFSIRNFDAIEALIRLVDYFKGYEITSKMNDMIEYVEHTYQVEHYIRAYTLSLNYLQLTWKGSKSSLIEDLNQQIDSNYPQMRVNMKKKLHFKSKHGLSMNAMILLFKINPYIVLRLWQLKNAEV